MEVAIIDGDVPYPANSGKRLRSLNLVLPLARSHSITYIARCSTADEGRLAADYLSGHGIRPVMVEAPLRPKRGAAFYASLAANLASARPYSITAHTFPAMREAARRVAAERAVALWQVESMAYLNAVQGMPQPVVLQAHNVEQLIWQRYLETEPNPLKKLYIRTQCNKMQRFEGRAFGIAIRVITVSEADAALARGLYRPHAVDVIDNGVDVGFFGAVRPDLASRTVLFLGALDWRPNREALQILLDWIFPALRESVADARLLIVGRNPAPDLVRRAAETAGVSLHANVPDVRPYMAMSAVMAVPLTIGGGSRLKILEAAAAGLPVISTAVGAEGLRLVPGEHFVLADTPDAMATALAAALEGRGLGQAAVIAARALVAANYDWPQLAARLERCWQAAVRDHTPSGGAGVALAQA